MKYNWNNKTIQKNNSGYFFCHPDCVFINTSCARLPIDCTFKEYYEYDKELNIFHL